MRTLQMLPMNDDGFGSVKAFFTILLIAILGVGGWFVYEFFTQPVDPTAIPIVGPHIAPPPATATYTDDAKVYSLTYPGTGWQVNAQSAVNESVPLPVIDSKVVDFIPPAPSSTGYGIPGLFNVIAFKSATPAQVLTAAKHGTDQTAPQTLLVNAYQAMYQQDSSSGGVSFTDDEYAVYHNGVTVYFTFRQTQGAAEGVSAFDATSEVPEYKTIVDSLKFLN